MPTFEARYEQLRGAVDWSLSSAMAACNAPQPLWDAMAYSLLGGGKRLRPVLLLAACEAGGGSASEAMPYALALEMIHSYSLVHDDLPCMDDDDMRRGRPSNHMVYGEGLAVLAGDALLSLAFETMLAAATETPHILAMRRIAQAAGAGGMVGGQCVDLQSERTHTGDAQTLVYIHRHKTADLFIAAVAAGFILAEAPGSVVGVGEKYAEALGTAFQIRDDLLDIEGDAHQLGKATGMDAARGKLTWPGLHGAGAARAAVAEKTQTALKTIAPLGEKGAFLQQLARHLLERDR